MMGKTSNVEFQALSIPMKMTRRRGRGLYDGNHIITVPLDDVNLPEQPYQYKPHHPASHDPKIH